MGGLFHQQMDAGGEGSTLEGGEAGRGSGEFARRRGIEDYASGNGYDWGEPAQDETVARQQEGGFAEGDAHITASSRIQL